MGLLNKYYPESKFGGFSTVDGTIAFYNRVNALLKDNYTVLDFGCGRGEYQEDPVIYRRTLHIIKGKVKKVIGVDVDPVAASNPYLDEFRILNDLTWPLQNNEVDLCVCDWVIEHIKDPSVFFSEAHRVIRPGGFLCIRTTNIWGYVGILSTLIPNKWHVKILSFMRTERKEKDIFPTYNACNTIWKLRRMLHKYGFDHAVYTHQPEPSYFKLSGLLYSLGRFYQRFFPSFMYSKIFAFAQNNKADQLDIDYGRGQM